MRGSSSSNEAKRESGNSVVNQETNRNTSNTVNDSGSANNISNRANVNGANRNGSAQTDVVGRAEAKVVRGSLLSNDDLTALSREELRRLRNAVYARHGRMFDSAELQRYFDSRPWYRPRYDYNESELTDTDRANIRLIQAAESSYE
jgi:hypothetical protein